MTKIHTIDQDPESNYLDVVLQWIYALAVTVERASSYLVDCHVTHKVSYTIRSEKKSGTKDISAEPCR